MNGYVGFYKKKRVEVFAETPYDAQCEIARILKVKKTFLINVELAEIDGKPVVHTPSY